MSLQIRPRPVWRQRISQIEPAFEDVFLPEGDVDVGQDAEWCEIFVDGKTRRLRFHDYDEIYSIPGLYEELFYERLQCCSPSRITRLLDEVICDSGDNLADLRVLDLGAGNGMVGDELASRGVDMIVGIDILPEAREAALRDRPGVYDDYLVADLSNLPGHLEKKLRGLRLNCLTSVAALGFGDIPTETFMKALDLIDTDGWIALTIKEEFLHESDASGFCRLVSELNRQRVVQTQAYRRYQHRVSISGKPLYYVALVSRKLCDVPGHLSCEELELAQR